MGLVEKIIEEYRKEWEEYTEHPIGKKIMNGTLDEKLFVHYLEQDALYLKSYGECWEKLAQLTNKKELKEYCLFQAKTILDDELEVNSFYSCKAFDQIQETKETRNYIDFMESYSNEKDFNNLFFCLLACFIGYAAFAQKLSKYEKDSKYEKWIEIYCSKEFWENAKYITSIANKLGEEMTREQQEKVGQIFKRTLILEKEFFDQGLIWKK